MLEHIAAYNNGQNVGHDHNIYLLRSSGVQVNTVYTTGASGNGLSSTQMSNATLTGIHSEYNGTNPDHVAPHKNCT